MALKSNTKREILSITYHKFWFPCSLCNFFQISSFDLSCWYCCQCDLTANVLTKANTLILVFKSYFSCITFYSVFPMFLISKSSPFGISRKTPEFYFSSSFLPVSALLLTSSHHSFSENTILSFVLTLSLAFWTFSRYLANERLLNICCTAWTNNHFLFFFFFLASFQVDSCWIPFSHSLHGLNLYLFLIYSISYFLILFFFFCCLNGHFVLPVGKCSAVLGW